MSKVIIGIHGLSNKPEKSVLENWWKEAMLEGLKKIDSNAILPPFELVYWADILNEKPLNEKVIDKDDLYFLEERYIPTPKNYNPNHHPIRQKLFGVFEKKIDDFFRNGSSTGKYSFLTDAIINKYFYELKVYFSNKMTDPEGFLLFSKDLIKNRLAEKLKKYEGCDIMIIAHSMGSVIAFDVLSSVLADMKINTLVSMGSPLGLPLIKNKLLASEYVNKTQTPRLKTPPGIQYHWFNYFDPDDKVAFDLTLSDQFLPNENGVKPIDFRIHNNYIHEGIRNPHKSFGYLRAQEFAEMLMNFIKMEEKTDSFYHKIWSFFFSKAS